jgi:ectoine hydroxylase-related dioxygenase (phytanoyl-CoA dioxygenase family)
MYVTTWSPIVRFSSRFSLPHRAIYREAFTGAHVDNVYMCRGTDQLYTMWTPMGDVTTEMGTLAMCEGSHRLLE